MKSIKVAAVQHVAKLGMNEENIARVTPLIEKAAIEGAQLVALPEMSISGYSLNKETWKHSEPIGGPSETWLKETAQRLGIYICAGLLQHEGNDFYNTYLVADPDGAVVGRVHKTQTEFNIHRPGALESHIVHTSLGCIGVGICADNHRTFFLDYLRDQGIDLMLQPHASPTPYKVGGLVSEEDVRRSEDKVKELPQMYARLLSVPVVFVNQIGHPEGEPWPGIIGGLMDLSVFRFPGYTAIVEPYDVKARMGDEEGFIVSDVKMEKVESMEATPDYGGWIHPGNTLLRSIIMPIDIAWGKIKYNRSLEQRKKLTKLTQ